MHCKVVQHMGKGHRSRMGCLNRQMKLQISLRGMILTPLRDLLDDSFGKIVLFGPVGLCLPSLRILNQELYRFIAHSSKLPEVRQKLMGEGPHPG